jgi:hypothetical protein
VTKNGRPFLLAAIEAGVMKLILIILSNMGKDRLVWRGLVQINGCSGSQ